MIIKNLSGRYERWNPVHPTSGAFWGMGIGLGCGVGWGPGFGPEVIGYVGAGCGVGFCVGITHAGLGIGLPANYVFEVPYKVLMATSSALEFARSSFQNEVGNIAGSSWNSVEPHISDFQRKVSGKISTFKHEDLFSKGVDLSGIQNAMLSHSQLLLDNLHKTGDRLFHPDKVLMATSSALEFARSSCQNEVGNIAGSSWNSVEPHISDFQRKVSGKISTFKHEDLFSKGVDLSGIQNAMLSHSQLLLDNLHKTGDRLFHHDKGSKD